MPHLINITIVLLSTGMQEAHPETNKRVPAIVDALEKLELTSKVYISKITLPFCKF